MYRAFPQFGQAKFPNGGLVLGSSQFSILPKLPPKIPLDSKVVKINPKFKQQSYLDKLLVQLRCHRWQCFPNCSFRRCLRIRSGIKNRKKLLKYTDLTKLHLVRLRQSMQSWFNSLKFAKLSYPWIFYQLLACFYYHYMFQSIKTLNKIFLFILSFG